MADANTCLLQLEDSLKRKLSESERKEFLQELEGIDSEKGLIDMMAAREEGAKVASRNAYMNTNAKFATKGYLQNVWGDDMAGGLQATIEGSQVARPGARDSVDARVGALSSKVKQEFFNDFDNAGVTEVFSSGKFDDELTKAMFELNRRVPNKGAVTHLPKEVLDTVDIIIKHSTAARLRSNKVGSHIPFLEGRVMKRHHDAAKIKAAGRQVWMSDIRGWIDWDRTMRGVPIEKRDEVLGRIYERVANGVPTIFKEGYAPGGALDARGMLKNDRVLHLKNAEGEVAYNKKYSRGSVASNIIFELDSMARDTAIMERFGPSPEKNINDAVNELSRDLVAQGKGDKAKELVEMHKKLKGTSWIEITQQHQIPENETAAKWGSIGRATLGAIDLGGAILSQLGDLAGFQANMRYSGGGASTFPFAGALEGLKGVLGNLRKLTPEQRQLASELGIVVDSLNPSPSKFEADTARPGGASEWSQKIYKWYGISGWQDRVRLTGVVSTAHRYANQKGKSFAELDPNMKRFFNQFGIEDTDWEIMRQGKTSTDWEGRELLTTKSIEEMPLERFSGGAEQKDSLAKRYGGLMSEVARLAATEPGAKVRGRMLRGTRPGSLQGEGLRSFWQYKSVLQTIMYEHMGRGLHGYHSNRVGNLTAIKRMFSDPQGGIGDMANMIATGTILGYLSITLKDLARGKNPKQPEDWQGMLKLMGESMAQGGAAGIYGDFLFGHAREYYGEGPLNSFLGPTFGRFSDLGSVFVAAKNGDPAGAKALKVLLDNIPGKNFILTRMAVDHLIMYRFKEMLDPGYLRRMERRMEKEGQSFYFSPTETIKHGGGF